MRILEVFTEEVSQSLAKDVDYEMARVFSKLINIPTLYKGKGRPRKTDYAIYLHPFGDTFKRLNLN